MNCGEQLKLSVAAHTGVKKLTESDLIFTRFIYVGNAQLGLPKERMVCTLKDLPLFSDGLHHGLKWRPAISCSKRVPLNIGNDLLDATPD